MKNTLKLTHISILLLILLFGGCQKCNKEVCPQATTAKFKVYETVQYSTALNNDGTTKPKGQYYSYHKFEGDTINMYSVAVTFEALETDPNATFEWKIGFDDRIKKEKQFSLTFSEKDLGVLRELDIQLVVRKAPNTKCNPTDNGVDTLIRKVYFIEEKNYPNLW